MKLLPFLAFLGSSRAGPSFLDFWKESDFFALQVRDQISQNGLGNRFLKAYKEVREVSAFYQSAGLCQSTISSPTYSPTSFDAVFDRQLNPGANMENLYKSLDAWIQSYACVDDSLAAEFNHIKHSMNIISKVLAKKVLAPKDVTWSISANTMTNDQARAYCYSRDQWLANPNNFNELETGVKSELEPGQHLWFEDYSGGQCQAYGKLADGGSETSSRDCNDRYHAFCYSGQIKEKQCEDGSSTWIWTDCPTTPTTTTTTTTTTKSDTYTGGFMVITDWLEDSFFINRDGSTKSTVQLSAPNDGNDYARHAMSAVVADQLYLFGGGYRSIRKIARLDSCAFVELSVRLNNNFDHGHAALAIEDGSKALICFGYNDGLNPRNYCDVFDGSTVDSTHSTAFDHWYGGLGFYKGLPTTVGAEQWLHGDGEFKVETLGINGWTRLADFQENIIGHILMGLANGDMLLIGGSNKNKSPSIQNSIWRLSAVSGEWTEDVALQKPVVYGSTINVNNFIYLFPGNNNVRQYPIQIIELREDSTIEQTDIIGYLTGAYHFPVLFAVDSNHCPVL